MPVIPVDKVVDKKRIIKRRAEEEEDRHKGPLTPIKIVNYRLKQIRPIWWSPWSDAAVTFNCCISVPVLPWRIPATLFRLLSLSPCVPLPSQHCVVI
jgi:hypothetical protein